MTSITPPDKGEYHEFYQTYVNHSHDKDILPFLEQQGQDFVSMLHALPEDRHNYKYGPDKWTFKQLLRHIIDAERVFSYRAMAIARGDKAALPGMDQNEYVDGADDTNNSFADLIKEFDLMRQANILMFNNLSVVSFTNVGEASDVKVSVRALLYIIVGHLEHHRTIISERYLEHV